ncbi:MAG: hypothetical protein IT538_08975 [Variibacter sp.]|nr:hypothetical protein [Variibacter sp.]
MLRTGRRALLALMLLSAAGGVLPPSQAAAAEARTPIVVDWRTGLALHGLDPVAYFAESQAAPGLPAFELSYAKVTWRFRNEGNRAAFAANAEVYMPRFGGYDPTALARGVATPGNPLVWLVFRQKLYLFHTPEARAAFLRAPEPMIAAGNLRWPRMQETVDITGSLPPARPQSAAPPPADLPRR